MGAIADLNLRDLSLLMLMLLLFLFYLFFLFALVGPLDKFGSILPSLPS